MECPDCLFPASAGDPASLAPDFMGQVAELGETRKSKEGQKKRGKKLARYEHSPLGRVGSPVDGIVRSTAQDLIVSTNRSGEWRQCDQNLVIDRLSCFASYHLLPVLYSVIGNEICTQ